MNRRGYPVPLARRYYAVRYARLGGQSCDPFWIEPDVLHAVGCISGRHANGASWMGTPAVITSCSPAKTFVPPPGRMGARAPSWLARQVGRSTHLFYYRLTDPEYLEKARIWW